MRSLEFTRWELKPEVSLAALLPPQTSRCGIYVLEFANGDEYVGQTVSLLSRVATHRRHWDEPICAVRFVQVPPSDLNRVEQDVIARLLDQGICLRNVNLVTLPIRSDALDLSVDRAVQEGWLNGEVAAVVLGDRAAMAEQRRRIRPQYEALAARGDFDDLVLALATYVRNSIPWPHSTEGRFWSVTSLPGSGRRKDWHRLSALSINNVEVLVLGEARHESGGWRFAGRLNVAGDARIPKQLRSRVRPGAYKSVGPTWTVELSSPAEVSGLFDDEVIAASARRLSIGLLRKGAGMFARFHDYNLADDVFRRMAASLESRRP